VIRDMNTPFVLAVVVAVLACVGAVELTYARQAPILATVGPDGSTCNYRPENSGGDPIGTALFDGADEIRIVSLGGARWSEDLNIARSVVIRGGFVSCEAAAAGTEQDDPVTVTGIEPDQGRVLTISTAPNQTIEVLIRRLSITPKCGGSGKQTNQLQGGAVSVTGGVTLTIENSTISGVGCFAEEGGLIHVSGGGQLRVDKNSVLQSGRAYNGGGIFCQGSEIYLGPSASMSGNSAVIPVVADQDPWGNGGGIYADDCDVLVLSRRDTNQNNTALFNNSAERHGGFAYAINGTSLDIAGGPSCSRQLFDGVCSDSLPVRFYQNYADNTFLEPNGGGFSGEGGAIYASGQLTDVSLASVAFEQNKAFLGGAVSITGNASLAIGNQAAVLSSPNGCGTMPCAYFFDNRANGRGGAVFFDGAGPVTVWFSEFKGNQAFFGSVLSFVNQPTGTGVAPFFLANSVFNGNGSYGQQTTDFGLIELFSVGAGEASVSIAGATFVNNQGSVGGGIFYSQAPETVQGVMVSGSLFVDNLASDSKPMISHSSTLNDGISGICVVSDHNLSEVSYPSDLNDDFADLQLENAALRDYRPTAESDAVDLCSSAEMPGIAGLRDFLNNERPKLGSVFSVDAPFDAGAIELQLEPTDDEIYQDRFQVLAPVIIN